MTASAMLDALIMILKSHYLCKNFCSAEWANWWLYFSKSKIKFEIIATHKKVQFNNLHTLFLVSGIFYLGYS